MSEQLKPDLSRAVQFQALHVHLPTDYMSYAHERLEQWREKAEEAIQTGETIKPLWLRRTDEMGSEFGAVIDYVMPVENETWYLASIDIDGTGGHTDISVHMPAADGSGEPVVVLQEAYTLPALQRAIEYVEATVQPNKN